MRALLLALVLLAGCASPARRIRRNQAAFDAYPAAAQQAIRGGRVEVGFTPEQVAMALGKPDRKYESAGPEGKSETWAWLTSEWLDYYPAYHRHPFSRFSGWPGHASYYVETKRVVFSDGKVVSFELRQD